MNFEHELPKVKLISGRHPFIVDRCKGKSVLHIGCVDAGLLEERYNKGDLLHQKLDLVCDDLWGCDVDESGVEYLCDKGFKNVFILDLEDEEKIESKFQDNKFEVVVLSEVAEHLLNPGKALELLGEHCLMSNGELIFSVPNAYSANSIWSMLNNTELVHPDHNYYFSYVTTLNILNKCNYEIKELYCYTFLEHLLPKKAKHALIQYEESSSSKEPLNIKHLYWKMLNYYKNIQKRMFFKYLFTKSNYWGEGLMITAKYKKN